MSSTVHSRPPAAHGSGGPDRPDIVIMVADHQAYYRHGWDSEQPVLRPRYDALRRQGATFERAYCMSPLCSPARRSILTGQYPHNHGEVRNDVNVAFDGANLISALSEAGYRVNYFGKWHAGPGTAHDLGAEGFCYPSYNNPYTKPEYAQYLADRDLPHPEIDIDQGFHPPGWGKPLEGRYIQDGDWCNEHATGVMVTPDDTHEAYFVANLAAESIRRTAQDDAPTATIVSFWGPHAPYFPTQRFLDMYDPARIEQYGSFDDDLAGRTEIHQREHNVPFGKQDRLIQPSVLSWEQWQRILWYCYAQNTLVDDAAGRVIDAVDETGGTENTLVLWLADHGDAIASHGGHFDKRSYLTEEVLRIPLAMRWPRRVAGGSVVQTPTAQIDVLPTVLEAATTRQVDQLNLDGTSLLGFLDPAGSDRQEIVVETHGHGERVLGRALVGERFKYVTYGRFGEEYYDLADDPFELHNLIGAAEHREAIGAARERLQVWRLATGDDATEDSLP
ncbi:sulfatase-like hydrolase/transferase [Ruania alba]|uniref:Arylsulfatase A n=1 Tax=Ruania alba TaxID=648782 RepID=A0A1H5KZ05_9MICO|nr:sulfatase-like hydrolase/transferase [Ruania alba]SEE69944.1 Arylsulfatase A [Ruania alba]